MDADLNGAIQKFAQALKSYRQDGIALSVAMERAGFDAQPDSMNPALSYAADQIVQAEGRTGDAEEMAYAIKQGVTKNGRTVSFVQADRQVITGEDASKWGQQVINYINNVIRNGKNVIVYSENGVPLTITEDTAGKAAYWNTDQKGNPVSEEEYGLKLRIESHIDEAAQVSIGRRGKTPDTKNHPFARDGFTYRTAYFEDFDGKYYSFQISIGNNGKVNTIYNVNRIEEAEAPKALRGSTADAVPGDSASSNGSISNDADDVNRAFSMKKENVLEGVEEDAALYAQGAMDRDTEAALGLVQRLYYETTQAEGAPLQKGAWESRVGQIADQMLKETGSTQGRNRLIWELRQLYTAMDERGNDVGEMLMYARDIAKHLLQKGGGAALQQDEGKQEKTRSAKQRKSAQKVRNSA